MEQHGDSSRKRGPDDETSGNDHHPKRRNNKGKGRAVDATGRHATPRIFFMSRNGAQLSECCRNHEPIPDAGPTPSVNLLDGADLWSTNADASDDSWHTMADQSPEKVNWVPPFVPLLRQSFHGTERTNIILSGRPDIPSTQLSTVSLLHLSGGHQLENVSPNNDAGPPTISAHHKAVDLEWAIFAIWRDELAKGIIVKHDSIGGVYAFVGEHRGRVFLKVGFAEHQSPGCAKLPMKKQVELVRVAIAKRVREQCTMGMWSRPRTWYWWGPCIEYRLLED
ncbi:hypothetical protein LTR10_003719 [Elasticomyces elasticus]|nr:hypothetical protein LTR10_003719 [Elasticomyces elasticus]KAK4978089.1 hypothetical protein LTR42_002466 [Elasticomyces elasticus]